MGEGGPEGSTQRVSTTWQVSFNRVEQESPLAVALLRLCAFLAPDDIPISALQGSSEPQPGELQAVLADDLELDRAVTSLRRYSLTERQDGRLRVHRLVQAVVRESLDEDQREAWLGAAIRLLRNAYPSEVGLDGEGWSVVDALLPHIRAVDQLAADRLAAGRGPVLEALAWLLDQAGEYLSFRGELWAARPLLERGLALRERLLGPDHPDTATSLTRLATLLRIFGDRSGAVALHRRALDIRERVLGEGHLDTAESLNNLAHALLDQGDVRAGRRLHERALAIREQRCGREDGVTATSLSNLALAHADAGQLAAARRMLERAVRVHERVSGPESRAASLSISKLAAVLRAQGELDAARALLERALAIQERALGPYHHYTAWSLSVLASLLTDQGELGAAAARASERASAIRRRVLPDEHGSGGAVLWPPRPGG